MFGLFNTDRSRKTAGLQTEFTKNILVAGRPIPLEIRKNVKAKRITLRIAPGGNLLKLTIPTNLRSREVDSFLERHQGWLETHFAKIPQQAPLEDGTLVPIRGVEHKIIATRKLRDLTRCETTETGSFIYVGGAIEHLPRRIGDYLKQEAKRELTHFVDIHTNKINRQAKSLRLRDTRSRWGSCTSDGSLNFSWRILMAPDYVINYLAAHEVAHMVEMNHGPKFWRLCEELCSDTKQAKLWLRKNGSRLQAIQF